MTDPGEYQPGRRVVGGWRDGSSVELASCVVDAADLPLGPRVRNYLGRQIHESDAGVPRCVRVWFDDSLWWRESFLDGAPLWQANVYVQESTQGGAITTCRPLRARGTAVNVGPWKTAVGVGLAWLGGGGGPSPLQVPTGPVYAAVTEHRAHYAIHQAGTALPWQSTVGPFLIDPDAVYDNGTFYAERFVQALRINWSTTALPLAGPIATWSMQCAVGGGAPPVKTGGIWPIQPNGSMDVTIDTATLITKSFSEVALSFEWVVYA